MASLPMYDWPELRPVHDRLWSNIRDRLRAAGISAPDALDRGDDLWAQWTAPDLVLSQTCGLPFCRELRNKVRYVASPDYGLEGCPPGYYASKIVVRPDHAALGPKDWNNLRLVINEPTSQSGFGSIMNYANARGVQFASVTASGAHRNSVQMVAEGAADLAAIDANSWRLAQAFDPCAAQLVVIGQTDPTPATPYITAPTRSDAEVTVLRAALRDAIAALPDDDRAQIHLRGIAEVPEAAYLAVPIPQF